MEERTTHKPLSNLPTAGEWWEALRWVYAAFTLPVALGILGSFVPYSRVVAHGHPLLPLKACAGCMMCGMTRGFCLLSEGRIAEAWEHNHGAPFLYVFGWCWLIGGAVLVYRHLNSRPPSYR